jgi:nucleotide-binding universal stress UspA family protein
MTQSGNDIGYYPGSYGRLKTGGSSMFPSKVLIPIDGSPASLRALDFAIEMGSQNPDTSFVLLNVQNISALELTGAAMGSDGQETASQASAKALKEAVGKSEAAGIVFKTLVTTGQPAEAIARAAREGDIKHIVMGTRGLGSIQGLLLGSVAMKVIHLAEVPITLIK